MSYQEKLQRVAELAKAQLEAQERVALASAAKEDIDKKLFAAWNALRQAQDEQVKELMGQLS